MASQASASGGRAGASTYTAVREGSRLFAPLSRWPSGEANCEQQRLLYSAGDPARASRESAGGACESQPTSSMGGAQGGSRVGHPGYGAIGRLRTAGPAAVGETEDGRRALRTGDLEEMMLPSGDPAYKCEASLAATSGLSCGSQPGPPYSRGGPGRTGSLRVGAARQKGALSPLRKYHAFGARTSQESHSDVLHS